MLTKVTFNRIVALVKLDGMRHEESAIQFPSLRENADQVHQKNIGVLNEIGECRSDGKNFLVEQYQNLVEGVKYAGKD